MNMDTTLKEQILLRAQAAREFSKQGAVIAMDFFGKAEKWTKADSSPVTEADLAIDKYLQEMIVQDFPQDGILSEETEALDSRFTKDFTWIIDPIDGTKEFIRQSNDFCVMIGLCYKGEAVYGVINIPATQELFYGGPGFGSSVDKDGQTYSLNQAPTLGNRVLISRSHRADLVKPYLEARDLEGLPCGSSGVKACRLIDQTAQHYIHGTTIYEWDTAAADALVRGAGAYFTDLHGEAIRYNKKDPSLYGIIATFSQNQLHDIRDFFKNR